MDHAKDSGKYNIIIIVKKHATSANDKYHNLPYCVSRIQRCKRYEKLRWLNQHFPDHEIIVEIDSATNIHTVNQFEENGHVEWRYNNFRLIDFTREELYIIVVTAILNDDNDDDEL